MVKKKILITGSQGFIGTALMSWLKRKYKLIGIDRVDGSYPRGTKFYCQDINYELPKIDNLYAVIHLAALPGVRNSHEKFAQVCQDNILGTQRIINQCMKIWKPKKLLLASSSSVYGDNGRDGHALDEDEIVNPRSPYAMSKVAGEELVRTYKNCGWLDNMDVASLRFFTVYGQNQRNELAIRAFTDWILQDKPITLYGSGEQKRDFTYIDDICSGIETLLNCNLKHDVYNIGSGNSISINKIIQMISEYTGKNVTINYQPRSPWDVDCTRADISRIKHDTSRHAGWDEDEPIVKFWEPKIKFEDGLEQQIEWQKKNLENL